MKDREESLTELLMQRMPELAGKVFVNDLPADVKSGVLFKEGYAGATIDPEIRGLRRSRFQIAVRDIRSNYKKAKDLSNAIIQALDIPGEHRVAGGILIKSCRALTEPISYPISDGANIEFSLNFHIVYVV